MKVLAVFLALFFVSMGCSSEDATEPTPAVPGNANDAGDGDDDGADQDDGENGGEDGDDTPDDTPPVAGNASALGTPCSSVDPLTQGDCPDGYTCMSGVQGVDPFCSIACTEPTVCNDGYAGPGVGNCVIGLEVNGAVQSFCGVICEDLTENDAVCGGQCDGSCPSTMQCSFDLADANMDVVGRMCL